MDWGGTSQVNRPLILTASPITFVAHSFEDPFSSTAQRLIKCPATDWMHWGEGWPGCWIA